MKIINQFKKLQKSSKIAIRFQKYHTEIFCETGILDYGVSILLYNGSSLIKDYEKFTLIAEQKNDIRVVLIKSKINSDEELEVFAYLIEYILFELSKKNNATPSDVKKYIEDWLKFSSGRAPEISIEKQIGLIGEIVILGELLKEFPDTNQLNNWCGPEGFKIDFIFSNKFGIEVKSRIQPFKDWVSISSIEQLDNDLEFQHMVICDFVPSDTGRTLIDFVNDVIIILNDLDQTNMLIEKMRKANFNYFTNYNNLVKLNLFKLSFFDTKMIGFPILKKQGNLRIDKIKYDINILGLSTIEIKDSLAKVRNQLV